jgi:protein gp37
VNSMSDLFHASVPTEFIHEVFEVMADFPQHQFQVLTKRPRRMVTAVKAWYQRTGRAIAPNIWPGTSVEDRDGRISAFRSYAMFPRRSASYPASLFWVRSD